MTQNELLARLAELRTEKLPVPGQGETAARHRRLAEVAREDVTLAKLAEAHWDAEAILAEDGREPVEGVLYGVWASEVPGQTLLLEQTETGYRLSGSKPFCSGLGLVDRVLVTAGNRMAEVDLRLNAEQVSYDGSVWKTGAFVGTHTGSVTFTAAKVAADAVVGGPGWYVDRPGFWHGACGPAACWVGGVAGLVDAAVASKRRDPHTVAHLGALHANLWGMMALLEQAGREIDEAPADRAGAFTRALKLRHLVETLGSDSLRRFARAYGPQPLSMNAEVARRYQEVDLFLRQSHAERDLEALGRALMVDGAG